MSLDNMKNFEQKEMMRKRPFTKHSWHDWLICYILEMFMTEL